MVAWASPQGHVVENPGRKALEYPGRMQEPGTLTGVQDGGDEEGLQLPSASNAIKQQRE